MTDVERTPVNRNLANALDVRCQWLPGTSNHVRLTRAQTGQEVTIGLRDFFRHTNHHAVDALHLRGLAHLKCDEPRWHVLLSLAMTVEGK